MSCVTSTSVRPASRFSRNTSMHFWANDGVADRQHLVDEHDVGVGLDHHREREPDHHPRRVVLELEVGEVAQLGEVEHGVEPAPRLAPRQAHHHAVEHDVLARRQLRVEPDAELDERGEPARHADPAAVGAVDAGQDLQQRALAGAVAADDPEELALADVERDAPRARAARGWSPARSGCSARSLSVSTRCCGMRKRLLDLPRLDDDWRASQHATPASVRAPQRRARQRRSRRCSKLERVREAGVARPASRRPARASQRGHEPSPGDPAGELGLAAERLVAAGQRAQRAQREPRERGRRATGGATKRRSARRLAGVSSPRAAGEQRLAPGPRGAGSRGSTRPARPAGGRAPRVPGRCCETSPKTAPAVLDVVVERPVDVGDVAGGERDEAEPVVVELQPGRVGERQRERGRSRGGRASRRR